MTIPLSIVIPTRDRPHLVGGALRSALAQTWTDLEIVVSDNGHARPADAVVAALDDPRVRRVRTPRPLLMHDSWRFALAQARGGFVTFLCDDDALHPRALERVMAAASATGAAVVSWRSCSWQAAGWDGAGAEGRFDFGRPFTDGVLDLDGAALLDAAYDLRVTMTDAVPKMLNTAVRRDVLDDLAAAGTPLFGPSCPDYWAMAALAATGAPQVLLDAPLLVAGATADSIGASATRRTDAARRFVEELRREAVELIMPEPPWTPVVWIAQTLMQCAAAVPALRGRTFDRVHAYGRAGLEIEAWRRAGLDVGDVAAELDRALAGPLRDVADDVRAFVAARRVVEHEGFLSRRGEPAAVLGTGPFHAEGGDPRGAGFASIDAFAAGLDGWLADHARRLDDLWDVLAARAGPRRRVVLYGLGANGRALLRLPPPPGHPLAGRLAACDDGADTTPAAAVRLDPADLDPCAHFVLVTPWRAPGLAARLDAAGFRPGADRCDLRSLGDAAAVVARGAGGS
ncbi:MAG: glycosyltransferase family A protein [Planctomycetota bacterium]